MQFYMLPLLQTHWRFSFNLGRKWAFRKSLFWLLGYSDEEEDAESDMQDWQTE